MDFAARSRLAVFCAIGAAASFSLGDAIVRMLSDSLPLHEIIFIRTLVSLPLTIAVLVPLEGSWRLLRTKRPMWHVYRGLAVVIATLSFFSALAAVPISLAAAVYFTAPLMITAFSAILLNEKVNRRRWAALAAGLIGVLLIIRPGTGDFQWTLLLPLIAAFAYAVLNTTTRSVGLDEPASTMSFYIQITFLVSAIMFGLLVGHGRFAGSGNPSLEFLLRAWTIPKTDELVLIAVTGITNFVGAYLISQAYRLGESGLVTPFEYVALITAVFYGYLFWDEIPDFLASAGILLILFAGVYVAVREARVDIVSTLRRNFLRW